MQNNRVKNNWMLDVIIYGGFLMMFFLELTGVSLHQWLGLAVGGLISYHLLRHSDWVDAVSKRFFGKTTKQVRLYFIVDFSLMLGFLSILVSGLAISTWFNFSFSNTSAWINFHVIASIITLLLTLVKVGTHWRWIVMTTKKIISQPTVPTQNPRTSPISIPVSSKLSSPPPLPTRSTPLAPVPVAARMDRKDFLKLMGISGVATLMALMNVEDAILNTTASDSGNQISSNTTDSLAASLIIRSSEAETNNSVDTADSFSDSLTTDSNESASSSSLTCYRGCPKGQHCSYPGRCRLYTDSNNNGLCDLGECA